MLSAARRTVVPSIYAAGDCTGVLLLASVAGMQGRAGSFSDPRWFFTQQHGKNIIWEILADS